MAGLLGMFAFVAVVVWLAGPRLTHRMSPLHAAFTMTAAGMLFLLTGSLGYVIRKSGGVPFLQHQDAVIWPQVWWGIGALVAAILFWRRALQTLGDPPRQNHA
jgi:hypothetical protein